MKSAVAASMLLLLILAVAACGPRAEESKDAVPPPTDTAATPASQPEAPASAENKNVAPAPAPAQSAPGAQPTGPASATNATPASVPPAPNPAAPPAPKVETINIPAGTTLVVATADALATDKNKVGDTFTANIAEPVVVSGKTVLPKGAKVEGKVQTLAEPGRTKGKAAISLVLTKVMVKDKTLSITTEPFSAEAESGKKKDAAKIGGAAGIGAIVGAIAGGGKGAAIGAAIGGGAGTTAVLATKGDQLKIDPETRINFVLKNGIDVQVQKAAN